MEQRTRRVNERVGRYQRLYDGVVGRVHVGVEGEGALSVAVAGCVAFGSNDPVLKQDKRHIKTVQMDRLNAFDSFEHCGILIRPGPPPCAEVTLATGTLGNVS